MQGMHRKERSKAMQSLNDLVKEYTLQLRKGQIQKAYKGIITFMSGLKAYLERRHPEYTASGLYFGYMDMTYFAFTPKKLKDKNLKIAIVYLHEQNRFDVWLAGGNRKVQDEYIEQIRHKDIGSYKLSKANPGVDSIVESTIVEHPDFDNVEELMMILERNTIEFANSIIAIL
jgi:hypothetical protein